jgi:hypothetical protein
MKNPLPEALHLQLVTVLRIQPHKPKNNADVVLFFSASTSLFNGHRHTSPTIKYLSIAPLLNVVLMRVSMALIKQNLSAD